MFDVTVKLVTLAVVETLRKTTFPVWILAVLMFAVRMFELTEFERVLTVR
ncbi:hypothetical protein [Yellowstone lake phycodnavirus 2]|nr:hypothetical protein AR678_gp001 [Yellowstone lake phycodnavirus 2]BAT22275.1 hypothetical protein [Yellowstone lake phycodnavirus 2]